VRTRSVGALGALVPGLPVLFVVSLAAFVATESHASCTETLAAPAGASRGALQEIPRWLMPIYVGASERYGLGPDGWAWLASINAQESDFGRDLSVSSAGAEGWMQFEPETWARYGVSADPEKPGAPPEPYDPWDAIYAAAHYLRASGAPGDWSAAVYAYNHAAWYVREVAQRAEGYLAEPRALTVAREGPGGGREDPRAPSESPALTEASGAQGQGVSISGTGAVFGGSSEPGIEVRDAGTEGGYWQVSYPDGRTLALRQVAVGPPAAGAGAPVIASDVAALREAGYNEPARYPRRAVVSATYLGFSPGAPEARGEGCMAEGGPSAGAQRIEEAADRLAAMDVPYVYGGGHMTPAVPDPGLDCSSSVSWVLQHAGWRIATMTSGEFATWGKPGPGTYVTLYANSGHVFMAIRISPSERWRYFGTSGFGHPGAPNGTGPAWFTVDPSPEYLAGFTMRHPPGL
jgi:cell wall-associated NlpC family hydrolase